MTKVFKYMFSRKSLPVIFLLLCAGLIVAFRSLGWGGGNPPTKEERILHNIGEMLSQIHYSPKKIDDNFSKEIFKKYRITTHFFKMAISYLAIFGPFKHNGATPINGPVAS